MSPTEPFSIHPDVKVVADGHVTTVTIDRPDTKNACTGDMWGSPLKGKAETLAVFKHLSGAGAVKCR